MKWVEFKFIVIIIFGILNYHFHSKRTSGFDMAPTVATTLPGAPGQHLAIPYTCLTCISLEKNLSSQIIPILIFVSCFCSLQCMYILLIQLSLLSKLRTIVVLLSVVCGCFFVFLFIICVKKAMLGYMSYCASLGRYFRRFYFHRGTIARLAGSYSPSIGNLLLYGRLAIVFPA